jgi:hypothetical protein
LASFLLCSFFENLWDNCGGGGAVPPPPKYAHGDFRNYIKLQLLEKYEEIYKLFRVGEGRTPPSRYCLIN